MTSDSEIRKLCEEVEERQKWRKENNWTSKCSEDVDLLLSLLRSKLEADRWIPVSTPPEKPGIYEVCVNHCSTFSHIETARYKMPPAQGTYVPSEDWVLYSDLNEILMDLFVTHWRPLPSGPEVPSAWLPSDDRPIRKKANEVIEELRAARALLSGKGAAIREG